MKWKILASIFYLLINLFFLYGVLLFLKIESFLGVLMCLFVYFIFGVVIGIVLSNIDNK